jgi:hypothetical protein
MSTLQADAARPIAPHAHTPNGLAPEAQCPYCGQPISRKDFETIRARIEAEEKVRLAKLEKALASKAQTEIHKAKLEAARLANQQIKKAKADQEALIRARLNAEREAGAKRLVEAVTAEKVKAFEDKTRLTDQLAEMQRKLEKKTAFDLGEQPEVDLFEALETAFPDDRVWRVVRGQPGPDVVVEVIHNGSVVGKIVLDSKNHKRWSNAFTSKLRADQLAEGDAGGADFGILATSVFPKDARSTRLHIQDGVIVTEPALVVVLVHLLRRQIIQNHTLKLSAEARSEKADELYAFILSPAYSDMLDRMLARLAELESMQAKEITDHQSVWKKRTGLTDVIRAVIGEFSAAVSTIIAGEPA